MTEIDLKWQAVTGAPTITITAVKLERAGDDGVFRPIATVAVGGGTYQDRGLLSGTYYYRISAWAGGEVIGYSNVASGTTISGNRPTPPQDPDQPPNPNDPPPGPGEVVEPGDPGTHGWYKVTLGAKDSGDGDGDVTSATGNLTASSDWIEADSAQDAMMQAISGTITVVTPHAGTMVNRFGDEAFRIDPPLASGGGGTFSGKIYMDMDHEEGSVDWDDWTWGVTVTEEPKTVHGTITLNYQHMGAVVNQFGDDAFRIDAPLAKHQRGHP